MEVLADCELVIPAKAGIQRKRMYARTTGYGAPGPKPGASNCPMVKVPCVYILASRPYGTLYTGVTSNLVHRVWQHKTKETPGFTSKYNVDKLVWYEVHETMLTAIAREKQIKNWLRRWKIELVEAQNPRWDDLYPAIN